MKLSYMLNIDGKKLLHECTYHTREALADGTERRVYERFFGTDGGVVTLRLVADQDEATGVFRCALRVVNGANRAVRVSRADVGVSFDTTSTTLRYFSSDWGAEYTPHEQEISSKFTYGVVAGRSCKGFIPYAQCHADDAVYALALGWSGNWTCTTFPWEASYCDVRPYTFCCMLGMEDEAFFHDIAPSETFETPFVLIKRADDAEQATLALRRYFKARVSILDDVTFSPMPAIYNGWWPYEDHLISEDVYLKNAAIAKELGLAYAVMDAGWFGLSEPGQTWYEKRGDWDSVNPELFPSGLKHMFNKAKALDIRPGIWCEIEAVGQRAQLLSTHEDFLARRDGRSLAYVCFGNQEARAWAMSVVDRLLGEYGAKWIKLDFNLDPGMGCNREDHDHGAGDGLYAHYIGYYQFLDEVHAKYPDVIIENCASGGLRGDLGMLAHCHWTFLSDPDHTELHLQIYWGALSMLHQSVLEHFSWSQVLQDHNGVREPITQDMPRHRFDYMMRAVLMGVPGFSYRLPEFPDWCLERLREHVAFFRETLSDFVLHGDAHRLTAQPVVGGRGERFPGFEFTDKEGNAVVLAFRLKGADQDTVLHPRALHPQALYQVRFVDEERDYEVTGAELMGEGLRLANLPEEASEVVLLNKLG